MQRHVNISTEYYNFCRVELSGQSKEFITVKANVVPRALVLLSQDKQKHIDCIKFGSAYYGTDVVHQYWLYNASPEETKFIAVLDDEGKGQEVVCTLQQIYRR